MSAAEPASDFWIASDKLGHFVFCGLSTFAGFALCLYRREWRKYRFITGAILGVIFGAIKEIGDGLGWWPGNISVRDMGADAVGIAVALAVLIIYEPQITSWIPSGGVSFSALEDKEDVP
jgi:hypothetical protein